MLYSYLYSYLFYLSYWSYIMNNDEAIIVNNSIDNVYYVLTVVITSCLLNTLQRN